MNRLSINSLSKAYSPGFPILDNINLKIKKGEFLVLVGPSGCGKSTLLRIIAGLDQASTGDVFVDDQNITQVSPADRNLAMVFQDYALYPSMTVAGNLSFGLRMRKRPATEIDQAVHHAAKILDIEHLLNRKPKQLSGGQRQRVAIGRAIVRNVKIFLYDEPLSNLDASLRSQMRIELASLHKKLGATSIYVTHDQIEAMTLADRIAVLDQGKIQQLGTPEELYNRPQNRFVASFIGSPAMNFFDGELSISNNEAVFVSNEDKIILAKEYAPANLGKCTLGVRPEAIKVLTTNGRESEGKCDFQVPVLLKEGHGHETHMITEMFNQQAIIRTANPYRRSLIAQVSLGTMLPITIDRKNLHWFDQNGNRIE